MTTPASGSMRLLAILLGAAAARLFFIGSPQLDYDEGVYWMSLRSLAAGHRLFAEVYSSQPPGFLLLLEPLFRVSPTLDAARLGVAAVSLLLPVGAWLAAGRALGPAAAVAAAVAAGFDPLLLRESFTVQADAPAVALAGLGFGVLAVACGDRPRPILAAAAGALAVLGLSVKLLALPVGAGFLVLLILRRDRRLWASAVAGAGLATTALLAPFAGDLPRVWQQVVGFHLAGRAVTFGGLGSNWPVLPDIEVLVVLVGLAGAVRERRHPVFAAAAAWGLAAAALLAVQRPVYPHHVVALLAPATILAGAWGAPLAARFGDTGGGALVAVAAFLGFAFVDAWIPMPAPTRPAAAALQARLPPGRLVVTDDPFLVATAGFDTPPELVDTSLLRIVSGDLTAADVEAVIDRRRVAAVLLGTGRLARIPGFRDWLEGRYGPGQDLGGGRVLYLVTNERSP